MLNLELIFNQNQIVTCSPRDGMLCCEEDPIFVFKIFNPLTREVIVFLPRDIGGIPARWNQFEIMLVNNLANIDLYNGHILVTKAGTWDYTIILVEPGSPLDLDNLDVMQEVETGMIQIHSNEEYPTWETNQPVITAY